MSASTLSFLPHRSHRRYSLLTLFILLSSLPVVLLSSFSSALAFTQQQTPNILHTIANRSVCSQSGVTKNPGGGYHFSWLHVDARTGYIMDAHNCIVDLRGFNTAGTEFGDGVSHFPGLTPQRFTWFNSMFKMNYIRLNLNVGWWNSDVYVPNAHMHYRAWIQQMITWAEQSGDYVLLNRTNEYQLPPCGGSYYLLSSRKQNHQTSMMLIRKNNSMPGTCWIKHWHSGRVLFPCTRMILPFCMTIGMKCTILMLNRG